MAGNLNKNWNGECTPYASPERDPNIKDQPFISEKGTKTNITHINFGGMADNGHLKIMNFKLTLLRHAIQFRLMTLNKRLTYVQPTDSTINMYNNAAVKPAGVIK